MTVSRRMPATEAFFDTNVLLYLLSGDAAKADRAETLMETGGVINVQVLNEFVSVCLRKLAMTFTEIREILGVIRHVSTVTAVDIETHELGLDLAERNQLAIYDAMIVAAASRAGCNVLYTEDLQHGQKIGDLTIRNQFL